MKGIVSLLLILALISCKENIQTENTVSEESLRRIIETLSSDDFQGRKPFTPGEEKTLAFLEQEAKRIGLQPGNGDSYYQEVPLVEIHGHASQTLNLEGQNKLALQLGKDFVAYTQRPADSVQVKDSELVFCGYGIVAPEYNWNDYEGLDMKGKIQRSTVVE